MADIDHEQWLTPAEAAQLLQVSEENIHQMLQEGKLPGRQEGQDWRILRSDLNAYFTNQSDPGSILDQNLSESPTSISRGREE